MKPQDRRKPRAWPSPRPLCPYPQVAHYSVSGSIDEAANFAGVVPKP